MKKTCFAMLCVAFIQAGAMKQHHPTLEETYQWWKKQNSTRSSTKKDFQAFYKEKHTHDGITRSWPNKAPLPFLEKIKHPYVQHLYAIQGLSEEGKRIPVKDLTSKKTSSHQNVKTNTLHTSYEAGAKRKRKTL